MSAAARYGGDGSPRRTGCCCVAGSRRTSIGPRRRSRSRPAPAGGSSWRSCSVPESKRIWPSRPTPRPPAARNGARRPTAPTLGTCELLAAGRLPESWIPPEQVLEMRARLQLFKDLREEHTAWVQRIHAILLHQGASAIAGDLLGVDNRRRLEAGEDLSPAGREAVGVALR